MSKSLVGMVAGAALLAGAAATHVNAEPLTLSTDQMDQVTAAGYAFVDGVFYTQVHEYVDKMVHVDKRLDVYQDIRVKGYFAEALAGANCHGQGGCMALTYTVTDVGKDYATSISASESATSGHGFFRGKKRAER
jgi:hypothetical protein